MIFWLILSLVLVALAAGCNAVMDVTMFKFDKSVFKTDNEKWNRWWSDRSHRFWIIQLNDGWHHSKMWMVFFLILAVLSHTHLKYFWDSWNITLLIEFIFYALVWNLSFNFCYDHLFIRKEKQ